jgi:hypothetical protein
VAIFPYYPVYAYGSAILHLEDLSLVTQGRSDFLHPNFNHYVDQALEFFVESEEIRSKWEVSETHPRDKSIHFRALFKVNFHFPCLAERVELQQS